MSLSILSFISFSAFSIFLSFSDWYCRMVCFTLASYSGEPGLGFFPKPKSRGIRSCSTSCLALSGPVHTLLLAMEMCPGLTLLQSRARVPTALAVALGVLLLKRLARRPAGA
ncbi:hypothetical protein BDQ17DRAFT_1347816, partial [Cyathus striatus]